MIQKLFFHTHVIHISRSAQKFSTCSHEDILKTIESQGGCLRKPNPCEFGGDCCTGSGGSLKKKGEVCRLADPTVSCSAAAVCDGVHAECGANRFLEDGTICDKTDSAMTDNHGVCADGICLHHHAIACSEWGGGFGMVGCDYTSTGVEYSCVKACIGRSSCLPIGTTCPGQTSRWTSPVPLNGCPLAEKGSP